MESKAILFISQLFLKFKCFTDLCVSLQKEEWEFTWKCSGLVVLEQQAKEVVPAMVNI